MPVELRSKRKAVDGEAAPAPAAKKRDPKAAVQKAASSLKRTLSGRSKNAKKAEPKADEPSKPAVGETVSLEGFGGEIQTNDGGVTTLKDLVEDSQTGVVLFTYPKASTPGCTNQVCLFRDAYTSLTAAGLSIYGLSADSPKANTNFQTKQNLQFPLLCDPDRNLVRAVGLSATSPLNKDLSKTVRGVFIVSKQGKVLAAQPGGPQATLDVSKKVVEGLISGGGVKDANGDKEAKKETNGAAD